MRTDDNDVDDDDSASRSPPTLASSMFANDPFGNRGDTDTTDACSDYRNVMQALRKTNSPMKRGIDSEQSHLRAVKRRAGILDEQEVGENWLDEDVIVVASKKAKHLSLGDRGSASGASKSRPVPRSSKENRWTSARLSGTSSCSGSVFNGFSGMSSSTTSIVTDDSSLDAFDVMMNPASSHRVTSSTVVRQRKASLSASTIAGVQRNSLLHAGFVQFKTAAVTNEGGGPVGVTDENVVSSTRTEPSDATAPASATSLPKNMKVTSTFKVKVGEQLLNVPVNNDMIADLTIGWLAEETSRRYYK